MASLAKRLVAPLRALRPRFAYEVESVVAPRYATQDEVAEAVRDIRRLLADQLDGDNEATAVLGREVAAVRAGNEAIEAHLAALSDRLDRIEALLRDAGTPALP
ncbi:MAG TPA: hypothetical protein VFJ85_17365 [Acidimicrobiales bacterium]|nr:hypothetical protein [Acidimicrobiales bacterium]